jgi:hypothetical protein
LIGRVLRFTSRLKPGPLAAYYRSYFAMIPRWIELQEALKP